MNISRITVDVEDIFKAIQADGYDHLRSEWIKFKSVNGTIKPLGGCLLGMAAINLGVVPDQEWLSEMSIGELNIAINRNEDDDYVLNPITEEYEYKPSPEVFIEGLSEALDSLTIQNEVEGTRGSRHWRTDVGYNVGAALIELNDQTIAGDYNKYEYSYAELTEFARQILTPHFGTKLELTQLDFTDSTILAG